jgi:beta-galactosidase
MCDIDEEYVHIPDTVAYNHYFGWYGGDVSQNGPWFDSFHEKYPITPIGISEYGAEALDWHSPTPKQGDYTEEYQAYYHERMLEQISERPYLFATYVWNMFDFGADARMEGGDNGKNHKGLVTFDRKYKKDSFYIYKAYLSDEPFVHICGKRYVNRFENPTRIKVYSNLNTVELFYNGISLGEQTSKNHVFSFDVPNGGDTLIKAVSGGASDECVIKKVNEPDQSYVMKEQGAVLNWFDVEAPEGRFSLNDTLEDIMTTVRGKLWVLKMGRLIKKRMSGGIGGFGLSEEMFKMMGGFTVLRLTGLMGAAGVKFSKEELLRMNSELNKIKKPKG